mgnify:CR=1 FL=1
MEQKASQIWSKACGHLSEALPKDVFDRWIAVIKPARLEQNTLVLTVANDFYQTWLEENYLPMIRTAVATAGDAELAIQLDVDAARHPLAPRPPAETAPAPRRKPGATPPGPTLNPKYTFENFVVGASNNLSHAAALAVAESPARAYNPLFIYGGTGLGKTHLMHAIGHYVLPRTKLTVHYATCETFTNEYIDALQKKTLVDFRRKYRGFDMLLIDDIHFLAGKERLQEEFFHTFNALFESHKQIVLTCDRPASEIPALEQRLVSRFEWGMMTELEPPDVETRIAILRQRLRESHVEMSDEVIDFMAHIIRANIRRLEGALIRVTSYASLTRKPVTTETVEHLLRDLIDQEQHEALTTETIQRAVAEYYDIRLGDMTGRQRPAAIALPRQVAMYLCRTLTNQSLPTIAEGFGRNHATVMHACRVVTDRMKTDTGFRQTVGTLKQRLARR